MKVIFLDIDGVLNHDYCKELIHGLYFVLDEKIELLKQIVDQTGAKLVLSSTWRRGWANIDYNIKNEETDMFIALKEKLAEFGLELYDRTPIKNSGARGEEIESWFLFRAKEPIESFVILDDMDGKYLRPYSNKLVQTSMKTGLTTKHVKKAIEILNTI